MIAARPVDEHDRRACVATRLDIQIDTVEMRLHDTPARGCLAILPGRIDGGVDAAVGAGAGDPSVIAIRLFTSSTERPRGKRASAGSQLKLL